MSKISFQKVREQYSFPKNKFQKRSFFVEFLYTNFFLWPNPHQNFSKKKKFLEKILTARYFSVHEKGLQNTKKIKHMNT